MARYKKVNKSAKNINMHPTDNVDGYDEVGGRKLIRMKNGTFVAAMKLSSGSTVRLVKSVDGRVWTILGSFTPTNNLYDFNIATINNYVYICVSDAGTNQIRLWYGKFNISEFTGGSISLTSVYNTMWSSDGRISLFVEESGAVHIALCYIHNSLNSYSTNVYYLNSSDGSASFITYNVTNVNVSGTHYVFPSLVAKNGLVYIIMIRTSGSGPSLVCANTANTTKNYSGSEFSSMWGSNILPTPGSSLYTVSATIDNKGVIHSTIVTYVGSRTVPYYIKSSDGITWYSHPGVSGNYTIFADTTYDRLKTSISACADGNLLVVSLSKANTSGSVYDVEVIIVTPSSVSAPIYLTYNANIGAPHVCGGYTPGINEAICMWWKPYSYTFYGNWVDLVKVAPGSSPVNLTRRPIQLPGYRG